MNEKLLNMAEEAGFSKTTFSNADGSTNFYCSEKQLEIVCKAYHKAKCAESEPFAYMWNDDKSCYRIFGGNIPSDEKITLLFDKPQPSDAEAKLKVLVDFLRIEANCSFATYDYAGNELNNVAKQALEKIGE